MEQFVVHLERRVPPLERPVLARQVAPRFGIPADKVERLLSREPGVITKPASRAEAERVADVFRAAGVSVRVRDTTVGTESTAAAAPAAAPTAAGPSATEEPSATEPVFGEQSDAEASGAVFASREWPATPTRTADAVDTRDPVPGPASGSTPADGAEDDGLRLRRHAAGGSDDAAFDRGHEGAPADEAFEPAAVATAARPDDASHGGMSHVTASHEVGHRDALDDSVQESVIWTPAAPADAPASEPRGARTEAAVAAPSEGRSARPSRSARTTVVEPVAPAKRARRRIGFSLRWKIVLTTLLPIALLAGATLYIAYDSVQSSAERLLTEVGDNIAIALAADMSTFIAENGLSFESTSDLTEIALYFARRQSVIAPALHETVGVHLTDPAGRRIAGLWQDEIQQNPRFGRLEERFQETTRAAIDSVNFGDPAEAFAATLSDRTRVFESFYVIGVPLINDVGTVQVVIEEGNVIQTALGVIQPIILVALVALALGIITAMLVAAGLTRRIRRLAQVADRISLGELDEPVNVGGNDEVKDVSESLERMRVSLKSAIDRLRKRSNRRQNA